MKLLYFKIITLFTTSNQLGNYKKSFSLYYYDLVRTLFVTLAFTGILSTGWFGIPLAPRYFTDVPINNLDIIFATFNSITKKNESGYFPVGPTDFWDRETVVPKWLDKGKYWHIMLRLQIKNKEILLKVVKDNDLPFFSGKRNVATTSRENLKTDSKFKKKYRYVVCVPQWLVMNTELSNFSRSELNVNDSDFGLLMNAINKPLGLASNDITQHEKQRIKYSWKF